MDEGSTTRRLRADLRAGADRAAARGREMRPPEEVVGKLLLARLPKGGHRHAERPGGVEDVADGAVLARGVRALKDDEERSPALGVEAVLELVDLGGVVRDAGLDRLFLAEKGGVARVDLVERHARSGLDPERLHELCAVQRHRDQLFAPSSAVMIVRRSSCWLNGFCTTGRSR